MNIITSIRNYFKKPTDIPAYLSGKDNDPFIDAYNVPFNGKISGDLTEFLPRVGWYQSAHEKLTLARLHLEDMIAHEQVKPTRPRILSKLQHTLEDVTHRLMEQENRMHRIAK